MLTVDEVAEWLGSVATIPHQATRSGRVPAARAPSGRALASSDRPAERSVYITGKGKAYHWDDRCHLLLMGWAKSFNDGGGATKLQEVAKGLAMQSGYHACRGAPAAARWLGLEVGSQL
jgi:hypothetical protein